MSILLLSKPLPGRSYVTSLWSTSYISSLSSGSFIWRFVKFVLRLTYVKKYSLSLFFNGLDWRIFCTSWPTHQHYQDLFSLFCSSDRFADNQKTLKYTIDSILSDKSLTYIKKIMPPELNRETHQLNLPFIQNFDQLKQLFIFFQTEKRKDLIKFRWSPFKPIHIIL